MTGWEPFTYEVDGVTYHGRRRWPARNPPPPIGSGVWVMIEDSTLRLAADNVWEQTITRWSYPRG